MAGDTLQPGEGIEPSLLGPGAGPEPSMSMGDVGAALSSGYNEQRAAMSWAGWWSARASNDQDAAARYGNEIQYYNDLAKQARDRMQPASQQALEGGVFGSGRPFRAAALNVAQALPGTAEGVAAGVATGIPAAAVGAGVAGPPGAVTGFMLGSRAGGAAAEGYQAFGSILGDMYDQLDKLGEAKLSENVPLYRDLRAQGMDHGAALREVVYDAGSTAAQVGGGITALIGGVFNEAGALVKPLVKDVAKKGLVAYLKRVGGGFIKEGLLEEAPQSINESLAGQIGVQNADPTQNINWGEAARQGAEGAVTGGLMGSMMSAIPARGERRAAIPVVPPRGPSPAEALAAGNNNNNPPPPPPGVGNGSFGFPEPPPPGPPSGVGNGSFGFPEPPPTPTVYQNGPSAAGIARMDQNFDGPPAANPPQAPVTEMAPQPTADDLRRMDQAPSIGAVTQPPAPGPSQQLSAADLAAQEDQGPFQPTGPTGYARFGNPGPGNAAPPGGAAPASNTPSGSTVPITRASMVDKIPPEHAKLYAQALMEAIGTAKPGPGWNDFLKNLDFALKAAYDPVPGTPFAALPLHERVSRALDTVATMDTREVVSQVPQTISGQRQWSTALQRFSAIGAAAPPSVGHAAWVVDRLKQIILTPEPSAAIPTNLEPTQVGTRQTAPQVATTPGAPVEGNPTSRTQLTKPGSTPMTPARASTTPAEQRSLDTEKARRGKSAVDRTKAVRGAIREAVAEHTGKTPSAQLVSDILKDLASETQTDVGISTTEGARGGIQQLVQRQPDRPTPVRLTDRRGNPVQLADVLDRANQILGGTPLSADTLPSSKGNPLSSAAEATIRGRVKNAEAAPGKLVAAINAASATPEGRRALYDGLRRMVAKMQAATTQRMKDATDTKARALAGQAGKDVDQLTAAVERLGAAEAPRGDLVMQVANALTRNLPRIADLSGLSTNTLLTGDLLAQIERINSSGELSRQPAPSLLSDAADEALMGTQPRTKGVPSGPVKETQLQRERAAMRQNAIDQQTARKSAITLTPAGEARELETLNQRKGRKLMETAKQGVIGTLTRKLNEVRAAIAASDNAKNKDVLRGVIQEIKPYIEEKSSRWLAMRGQPLADFVARIDELLGKNADGKTLTYKAPASAERRAAAGRAAMERALRPGGLGTSKVWQDYLSRKLSATAWPANYTAEMYEDGLAKAALATVSDNPGFMDEDLGVTPEKFISDFALKMGVPRDVVLAWVAPRMEAIRAAAAVTAEPATPGATAAAPVAATETAGTQEPGGSERDGETTRPHRKRRGVPTKPPAGIDAYHASPHIFDRFDLAHLGRGEGGQIHASGFYFASVEDVAKSYLDAFADRGATLYRVRLNVAPGNLLDWDKPLAEQSAAVKVAMKKLGVTPDEIFKSLELGIGMSRNGDRLVQWLDEKHNHDYAAVRQALEGAGVEGIQYFDAHSRAEQRGTKNYVVFDPAKITVLSKTVFAAPPAENAGAAHVADDPQGPTKDVAPTNPTEADFWRGRWNELSEGDMNSPMLMPWAEHVREQLAKHGINVEPRGLMKRDTAQVVKKNPTYQDALELAGFIEPGVRDVYRVTNAIQQVRPGGYWNALTAAQKQRVMEILRSPETTATPDPAAFKREGVVGKGKSLDALNLPLLDRETVDAMRLAGYEFRPAALYESQHAPRDVRFAMIGTEQNKRPVRIVPPRAVAKMSTTEWLDQHEPLTIITGQGLPRVPWGLKRAVNNARRGYLMSIVQKSLDMLAPLDAMVMERLRAAAGGEKILVGDMLRQMASQTQNFELAQFMRELAFKVPEDTRFHDRSTPDGWGVFNPRDAERGGAPSVGLRNGFFLDPAVWESAGKLNAERGFSPSMVFLHEVIHASTWYGIEQIYRAHNSFSQEGREANILFNIGERLRGMLQDIVGSHSRYAASAGLTNPVVYSQIKDLHEMVAYAGSDPQVQAWASAVTLPADIVQEVNRVLPTSGAPINNLWKALTAWIGKIIGFGRPSDMTLLDAIHRYTAMASSRNLAAADQLRPVLPTNLYSRMATPAAVTNVMNVIRDNPYGSVTLDQFATLGEKARRGLLGAMSMDHIIEQWGRLFERAASILGGRENALEEVGHATGEISSTANRLLRESNEMFRKWSDLKSANPDAAQTMNTLMGRSTQFKLDAAEDATHRNNEVAQSDPVAAQELRQLRTAFNAMPAEYQAFYKTVRDHYVAERDFFIRYAMLNYLTKTVAAVPSEDERTRLAAEVDKVMSGALKVENIDGITTAQERILKALQSVNRAPGAYFPLKRAGNYVVNYSEPFERTFASAQEANDFAHEWLSLAVADRTVHPDGSVTLKGTNKLHEQFETLHEANARRADLVERVRAAGGDTSLVSDVLTKKDHGTLRAMPSRTYQSIRDAVAASKELAGNRQAVQDLIDEVVYRYLPDTFVQKAELRRRYVSGAIPDMQRAFALYAHGSAYFMANLQHGWRIDRAVRDMEETARQAERLTGHVKPGDQRHLLAVVNEIKQRVYRNEEIQRPSPVVDRLRELNTVWFLTSPSYHAISASQPWIMGIPVLGARYGYSDTARALGHASSVMMPTAFSGGLRATLTAITANKHHDVLGSLKQNLIDRNRADLATLLDEAANQNQIEYTRAFDLMQGARNTVGVIKGYDNAIEATRALAHATEVGNRAAVAIATYELERRSWADPNNGTPQEIAKATDAAIKMIKATMFNYTPSNRARYMNPKGEGAWPALQLMFQFKQHAYHMYYTLISNFATAVNGATPEERKIALKTLLGVLGTHFMMAGVRGIMFEPIAWAIGLALMAFGADDKDYEDYIQNFFHDLFGKELGDAIASGAPRALGIDLTGRLSLKNLLFMGDLSDIQKDGAMAWLGRLVSGPTGGIFESVGRGLTSLQEGDDLRAVEGFVPKGIRDIMRAYRFYDQGMLDTNGHPILKPEEMGFTDFAAQALGFRPSSVALASERRYAIQQVQHNVQQRHAQLLERYGRADAAERARLRAVDIPQFNRDYPQLRITGETLSSSLEARSRRDQNMLRNAGVFVQDTQRQFLNYGRFGGP